MIETGVVQSVEGSEVLVRLKRHKACSGCRACSVDTVGDMIIRSTAPVEVKTGDKVTVEIDPTSFLKAIAMLYILPTAAFLAGVLAGPRIAPLLNISRHKEIFSALTGVILLCAAMLLARAYGVRKKSAYNAKITRII